MAERRTDQYPQEQSHQNQPRDHQAHHLQTSMNISWWRSSLFGYLACPLLISTATFSELSLQLLRLKFYTPSALFYLATIITAWLWGIGPALLAIVLGYLALDIFIIPPSGVFTFNGWSDTAIFFPFLLTQLCIVLITVQREKAKRQAQAAEQRAKRHAQELAEANQLLSQSKDYLEELTNRLQEANQLKDYFLSRASHELKTPITTIQGQTQFALRRISKSPQAVPEQLALPTHLHKIESQTRRLHALVDNLLDQSSLSSGKMPLQLIQCNFGSLCREVVDDQRTLSGRHIELELPSEPVMLYADSQRLTQTIINLVTNAIKYSPENTVIRVCIIQESSHAILKIHNEGLAIPQEHLLHIFKPFYRAPEAQNQAIQGWGLGLSISKEIVEQHSGQIWVESSEAKGTTFFVQLPLQEDSDSR